MIRDGIIYAGLYSIISICRQSAVIKQTATRVKKIIFGNNKLDEKQVEVVAHFLNSLILAELHGIR